MAIKIPKLVKGIFGAATSIIPFGGVVKGLLGLAAKKIPGADKVLNDVFVEAEAMYRERKDIRDAYLTEQKERNKFILESEGRYADLKTKAEGIIRTFTRPVLTIGCVTNLIIMLWNEIEIHPGFIAICVLLVTSWCGTKGFRDWRKRNWANKK
jgi:hypothetical protein